jgi:hypothetical protein
MIGVPSLQRGGTHEGIHKLINQRLAFYRPKVAVCEVGFGFATERVGVCNGRLLE